MYERLSQFDRTESETDASATALADAERHAATANFPPGTPQSYLEQPYVAEMLGLQGLAGAPEQWATMHPERRLAMFARAAAAAGDLAERIDATTSTIQSRLREALAQSSFCSDIETIPSSKTIESTLEKLARRHSKSDPDKRYLPVSDQHRYMLICDTPMDLLVYLRDKFGGPDIWLDGRPSVYEGKNPHNPCSHEDYFGRRAKLCDTVDGQVVFFEVQGYTRAEYENMYIPTRPYYEAARAGRLAVGGVAKDES